LPVFFQKTGKGPVGIFPKKGKGPVGIFPKKGKGPVGSFDFVTSKSVEDNTG